MSGLPPPPPGGPGDLGHHNFDANDEEKKRQEQELMMYDLGVHRFEEFQENGKINRPTNLPTRNITEGSKMWKSFIDSGAMDDDDDTQKQQRRGNVEFESGDTFHWRYFTSTEGHPPHGHGNKGRSTAGYNPAEPLQYNRPYSHGRTNFAQTPHYGEGHKYNSNQGPARNHNHNQQGFGGQMNNHRTQGHGPQMTVSGIVVAPGHEVKRWEPKTKIVGPSPNVPTNAPPLPPRPPPLPPRPPQLPPRHVPVSKQSGMPVQTPANPGSSQAAGEKSRTQFVPPHLRHLVPTPSRAPDTPEPAQQDSSPRVESVGPKSHAEAFPRSMIYKEMKVVVRSLKPGVLIDRNGNVFIYRTPDKLLCVYELHIDHEIFSEDIRNLTIANHSGSSKINLRWQNFDLNSSQEFRFHVLHLGQVSVAAEFEKEVLRLKEEYKTSPAPMHKSILAQDSVEAQVKVKMPEVSSIGRDNGGKGQLQPAKEVESLGAIGTKPIPSPMTPAFQRPAAESKTAHKEQLEIKSPAPLRAYQMPNTPEMQGPSSRTKPVAQDSMDNDESTGRLSPIAQSRVNVQLTNDALSTPVHQASGSEELDLIDFNEEIIDETPSRTPIDSLRGIVFPSSENLEVLGPTGSSYEVTQEQTSDIVRGINGVSDKKPGMPTLEEIEKVKLGVELSDNGNRILWNVTKRGYDELITLGLFLLKVGRLASKSQRSTTSLSKNAALQCTWAELDSYELFHLLPYHQQVQLAAVVYANIFRGMAGEASRIVRSPDSIRELRQSAGPCPREIEDINQEIAGWTERLGFSEAQKLRAKHSLKTIMKSVKLPQESMSGPSVGGSNLVKPDIAKPARVGNQAAAAQTNDKGHSTSDEWVPPHKRTIAHSPKSGVESRYVTSNSPGPEDQDLAILEPRKSRWDEKQDFGGSGWLSRATRIVADSPNNVFGQDSARAANKEVEDNKNALDRLADEMASLKVREKRGH